MSEKSSLSAASSAAETQSVSSGQAPSGFATTPKKQKKKRLIIAGIIAGVLMLLGGGTVLAYNLWYQNPEKVVHDAVINAVQAKSTQFTGNFTLVSDQTTIDVKMDGKSSGTDSMMNATMELRTEGDGQKLSLAVDASVVQKDDTFFLKIKGLQRALSEALKSSTPLPPAQSQKLKILIDKYDDRWMSVKPADYRDVSKEAAEAQECVVRANKTLNDSDSEARKEIVDLYKENTILTIKNKLGSHVVNETGSLGYEVGLDKTAAESFIRKLNDTKYGKEIKACDTSLDFTKMADRMKKDDTTKSYNEATVELWASRFGHKIRRMSIRGNDDSTTVNIVVDPIFNENIDVEAPADAVSIKDVIRDVQEFMMDL